jgi:hypothetical protein
VLCSWSVAAASIQMAQQPSCEPTPLGPATLRVLMCENFHHSCRRHVARVHLQPSGARVVTASTPSLFDTDIGSRSPTAEYRAARHSMCALSCTCAWQ